MSNPLDTDAGSELFSSYEAELKLVQADLSQKLDQITELSGEPRKSAVRLAERSLEEANELVRLLLLLPPYLIPVSLKDCLLTSLFPARPNAHRKTKHPLRRPLPPESPFPQLRIRHRRLQTETQSPVRRPQSPVREPLPRRREQRYRRPSVGAAAAIAVGNGPLGSEFAAVEGQPADRERDGGYWSGHVGGFAAAEGDDSAYEADHVGE